VINNAALIGLAGSTGAITATVAAPAASPMVWIMPIVTGCFAAAIVRGISISTPTKRKRVWMFEALVTALSVLLTGVIVYDRNLGIMYATIAGVGIGGLGVGVITIARTAAATMITNLAKSVLSATDPPKP
jgi:hypothetical protein